MMTRIGAASYLTLAALLMTWAAPGRAAIQILGNEVTGTLYLVNLFGSGTADAFPEEESRATAISQDGEIVGFARGELPPTGQPRIEGFRASALSADGKQYLGTAIRQPGLSLQVVRPFGVNQIGVVVGEAATSASPNAVYAFREDPRVANGSSQPYLDGPGKALLNPTSVANAVNAGGEIVGQNNLAQAYRLAPGPAGSLVTLAVPSAATAINDAGNFVGWRQVGGQERAFLYDGSVHDLLPAVQAASEASALNNRGDVVGSIAVPQDNGNGGGNARRQAFLLQSDARPPERLGVVNGYSESFARGINDRTNPWVVGAATGAGQARTAWLWVDGQLFDLSTQLDWNWWNPEEEGATGKEGFSRLFSAAAVNNNGLIVGEGEYWLQTGSQWKAQRRAFVLALNVNDIPAIPEPGIYLMLLSGLFAIGAVRLRRLGAH